MRKRIFTILLVGFLLTPLAYIGGKAGWVVWVTVAEGPLCMTDEQCWEWKCDKHPDAHGCENIPKK